MKSAPAPKTRPVKLRGPRLGRFDRFTGFAFKVFGKQAKRLAASRQPKFGEEIMKSNMRVAPEGLISVVFLSTTISALIGMALVAVALFTGIIYFALGMLAPPLVFLVAWKSPKISQSGRAAALENEYPFMIGFMEVLAGGGVSPISALRRMSKMEKIFPAASKEAKRILVDIDVFGTDPITAFEKAAKYNPHKAFTNFLYGYTTVLKTGGDVTNYVGMKMKETFDLRTSKIKRTTDSIGTLAEAYLTVTSVLGISLFTLYQTQAVLTKNSAGLSNLFLFSFLGIPMISVLFVWILDGVQPKQPNVDMRPYKLFGYCIPLGALIYLLPIPISLPLKVSAALIAMVLGPMIVTSKYTRETRGMENALPDFIRDVAEGRKVGLPPEGSIEALATKDYGTLTLSVRKMASQISWGLTIQKVISSFVVDVKSWITKVAGTLMVEVVDVGGGTVKSFSEMADFTRKVNETESDRRAALRPFVFVVYMSGILLVFSTFTMVYFLSEPAALLAHSPYTANLGLVQVDPNTVSLLLVTSIFDSWVVGFVAGKMGNGAVADGFKHALSLVAISIISIYVTGLFIPINFA